MASKIWTRIGHLFTSLQPTITGWREYLQIKKFRNHIHHVTHGNQWAFLGG